MINKNDLAREISLLEGKKESVNIAQIKEVLKYTLEILSRYSNEEVIQLLDNVRKE